jgi:hypothetical protein
MIIRRYFKNKQYKEGVTKGMDGMALASLGFAPEMFQEEFLSSAVGEGAFA